jgi:hypothetical protein
LTFEGACGASWLAPGTVLPVLRVEFAGTSLRILEGTGAEADVRLQIARQSCQSTRVKLRVVRGEQQSERIVELGDTSKQARPRTVALVLRDLYDALDGPDASADSQSSAREDPRGPPSAKALDRPTPSSQPDEPPAPAPRSRDGPAEPHETGAAVRVHAGGAASFAEREAVPLLGGQAGVDVRLFGMPGLELGAAFAGATKQGRDPDGTIRLSLASLVLRAGVVAPLGPDAVRLVAAVEGRPSLVRARASTTDPRVAASSETHGTLDVAVLAGIAIRATEHLDFRLQVGGGHTVHGYEARAEGRRVVGWRGWYVPVRLAVGYKLP